MVAYTHEELTQLFRGLESDTVERKRSWESQIDIRKNVCAFANDLPGEPNTRRDLCGSGW